MMKKILMLLLFALMLSCTGDRAPAQESDPMTNNILLIYSPEYNIELGGIEQYHPFDTKKYQTVHDYLVEQKLVREKDFIVPAPVTDAELLLVHTRAYLDSLSDPRTAARIAEVNEVAYFPIGMIDAGIYRPMRFATGGTVLGARLALEKGAAVNLSGGFHHAQADSGGGFCYFSDIALAVTLLWKDRPDLTVLVVDLDAHQGNGYASIFADDQRVFILDVYNEEIFPKDKHAEQYIDYPCKIKNGTGTEDYLALVAKELPQALAAAQPGLVIYIAGTDICHNDPLGHLDVSEEGIMQRDELVFREVRGRGVPILMLLAGGYTRESGEIIARSIGNLLRKREAGMEGHKKSSH
jgi:histone deacetylase 11